MLLIQCRASVVQLTPLSAIVCSTPTMAAQIWKAGELINKKTELDDNYISRALCTTGPVNQHDFTIHNAVNIGSSPKYNSEGRGCWIYPLGCLYIPASHPRREEFHEALLTIANKGSHPIHVNLTCFELSAKNPCNKINQNKRKFNRNDHSHAAQYIP